MFSSLKNFTWLADASPFGLSSHIISQTSLNILSLLPPCYFLPYMSHLISSGYYKKKKSLHWFLSLKLCVCCLYICFLIFCHPLLDSKLHESKNFSSTPCNMRGIWLVLNQKLNKWMTEWKKKSKGCSLPPLCLETFQIQSMQDIYCLLYLKSLSRYQAWMDHSHFTH